MNSGMPQQEFVIPTVVEKPVLLSVVIPCYNHGEFLNEAIASVESCGGSHWEIIVVNDGSTNPLTLEQLSVLKAQGYQVIDQENQGLSAARNCGIRAAKGCYILPLDADNCVKLPYLTRAIELLEQHPDVGVVYGNLERFGSESGLIQVPRFSVDLLLRGNAIDACAVFRRSIWSDIGGYDSKIPDQLGYEDWDFWLSIAERGWQFLHLEAVGFAYRCRPASMVSGCNIPEQRSRLFEYICAKHAKLYATHFPAVFAGKEAERLAAVIECERLQNDLLDVQEALTLERDRLQQLRDRQVSHLAELAELRQSQSFLKAELDRLLVHCAAQSEQIQAQQMQLQQMSTTLESTRITAQMSWWQRLKRRLKRGLMLN